MCSVRKQGRKGGREWEERGGREGRRGEERGGVEEESGKEGRVNAPEVNKQCGEDTVTVGMG